MLDKNCWISFYEWKGKVFEKHLAQMMDSEKVKGMEIPKHKWKSIDGKQSKSTYTFPPFKSILLEEEEKQSKAIPRVLAKEDSQMSNSDKKIHIFSEQINWTNISLRGMDAHTFFTNDYYHRRHVDQLQVSINELVSSNNSLSLHISESK